MPAEKKWRHPVHKTLNFETDRYKEFQDICWSERKSVSEKLDEMIIEVIEKKVVGERNPIDVSYNTVEKKPFQSSKRKITLDEFIEKIKEIESPQVIGQMQGVLKQKQLYLKRKNSVSYF